MSVTPLRCRAIRPSTIDTTGFAAVEGEWDHRPQLLPGEVEALATLDAHALRRNRSAGISRRTAASWRALERLVGPLDTARSRLHHDDGAQSYTDSSTITIRAAVRH